MKHMKTSIPVFLFAILVMVCFSGCQSSGASSLASTVPSSVLSETSTAVSSNAATQADSQAYNQAVAAYQAFLVGSVTAVDKNNQISESGTVNIKDIQISATQYALYDMNGDGIPELHLMTTLGGGYDIFTYIDSQVVLWHDDVDYYTPLNNRALRYERIGDAAPHINYQYEILDFYGNTVFKLEFMKYDIVDKNDTKIGEKYTFDGVDIAKEQWDALTKRYLSVPVAPVKWQNLK